MKTEMIVDVEFNGKPLQVVRVTEPDDWNMHNVVTYNVIVDGVVRHPKCQHEDAIRALGHYLHTATK